MIIEFSVFEDEEGRSAHIFGSDIIYLECFDEDVECWYLNYFIDLDERHINEGYAFFISTEDLNSFVGHVRLIEFD